MCLAIPGKIVKIKDGMATIDYITEKREAKIIKKGFKIGDYVFVQSRIIVEKIPKKDAEQWFAVFKDHKEES